MNPSPIEVLATVLFALALVHTFSAKLFEKLAHRHPKHSGLFHWFGEVEIVFGLWAIALFVGIMAVAGKAQALEYVDGRNYTEPLFVLAVMVVAASKPILCRGWRPAPERSWANICSPCTNTRRSWNCWTRCWKKSPP